MTGFVSVDGFSFSFRWVRNLVIVEIELLRVRVVQLHRLEVDLVPEHAADTSEPSNELRPLLTPICDDLQGRSENFIIVGQPFKQWHLLFKLQLNSGVLILQK